MAEKDKSIKKDKRSRNWTCVVYPDSAPDNWRSVLDDLHIRFCCKVLNLLSNKVE